MPIGRRDIVTNLIGQYLGLQGPSGDRPFRARLVSTLIYATNPIMQFFRIATRTRVAVYQHFLTVHGRGSTPYVNFSLRLQKVFKNRCFGILITLPT